MFSLGLGLASLIAGLPVLPVAQALPVAPAVLRLTPAAVGRVPVGGSAREAERMLRRVLGTPNRTWNGKGCELDPASGPRRALIWGSLTVSLEPAAGAGRLIGWTVGAGRIPPRVRLPHGVTTATTVGAAKRAIPGAITRWDEVFQKYWITTPAEPSMRWAGDRADGSGRITYLTNAFEPCE
ncbi:hypothetical protein [Actinoplanes utahensis]|uniref:Uncharacterized protein n=1 Tax=Actinoplanes utahensis TaxID=1869 RepID=A0A0A6UQ64_ACTUT|nr:hypothetical protein [Actinoplanes utahensis]KHD77586.1 hypothetical protein MB27_10935 [Actinoplanes utahensis]GIF32779.1 hypothetical protein Aut01nite_57650 [Actinoplanes utahensis]